MNFSPVISRPILGEHPKTKNKMIIIFPIVLIFFVEISLER